MMLDTDVVVDLLRGYPPAVAWLSSQGGVSLLLPGLVAMEVLQGCRARVEQKRTHMYLRQFAIAWPSAADCDQAFADFAQFRLSHNVGLLDSLIAHTAIGRNEVLATFNTKHFQVIGNLQTIQPY